MSYTQDRALLKDLTEARADLTRHGIVIIRTIESELEPAIMADARDSMASSPRKLAQLKEGQLDEFVGSVREEAAKSSAELKELYTRLLARLGTEPLEELADELEGIDQLFKWDRIAKSMEAVNSKLAEKGFRPIELSGAKEIADNLAVELEDRWPVAFSRFRALADRAVKEMKTQDKEEALHTPLRKVKKPTKKR